MSSRRQPRSTSRRSLTPSPGLRPEEFPVGSAQSRAAVRTLLLNKQKRIAVILTCQELPLRLETSTCTRNMTPGGTIIEVVCIDGNVDEMTEAQLDEFILRHPIHYEL
jgi:hypothetical protein